MTPMYGNCDEVVAQIDNVNSPYVRKLWYICATTRQCNHPVCIEIIVQF